MKISITVYADSATEAELIIEAMKKVDGAGKFLMAPKEARPDTVKPWAEPGGGVPDEDTKPTTAQHAERPNVSPGKPSISKIGGSTKDLLMSELDEGKQPSAKYAEHLKLLWSRGEVKYDGKEYYT